jgi:Flp pilus assembly pilin Flp
LLSALLERTRDSRGQTMTEYAMIFVAIALLAYAGYQTLGNSISGYIDTVASFIASA